MPIKRVTTRAIENYQVTTDKLANESVTGLKLYERAVSGIHIGIGAVDSPNLASNAVTTAKIADAAITAAKLNGAQSGSAPIYGARAWVNFNGTGTVAIRASGNVSSITDGGTGVYTVNFTTAMPDTNYSVTVTARRIDANNANFSAVLKGTTSANTNYPLSTTNCEVICGTPSNNAFVDSDVYCVSVFR